MKQTLLEIKRKENIQSSKNSANYKTDQSKGKNRYERRLHQKIQKSTKELNQIDMNKFFKDGVLDVNLKVTGETNEYIVTISFQNLFDDIRKELEKESTEVTIRIILRSLIDSFNREDVFVRCSCPDFCLVGDTKIKLLNGEVDTIENIVNRYVSGEELWVYSVDENGDFKPGKITNAWKSGYTKELVKITLDNDESIVSTPNHQYMKRNGSYIEAKDLTVGDSLMPLYFSYHNGYENVKKNSDVDVTRFFSVYKTVANELLQEQIEEAKIRSGEQSVAIHHKDFNKLNNNPSNLFPMGTQEHYLWHSNHVKESGQMQKWLEGGRAYWATKEARDKQAIQMSNTIKDYWNNMSEEEYRKACERVSERNKNPEILKKFSDGQRNAWKNYTEEQYKQRCEINRLGNERSKELRSRRVKEVKANWSEEKRNQFRKNNSEAQLKFWTDPQKKRKILEGRMLKAFQRIIDSGQEITEESYNSHRYNSTPKWETLFETFQQCKEYFKINHSVKNIEFISFEEDVPVYDLSIDKYNNFYVNAGVILHNCYRIAYHLSRHQGIYGEPELRPNRFSWTNKDDTAGRGCKHIEMAFTNNRWLFSVASVIYQYIQYMKKHREDAYAKVIYPALYDKEYEKDNIQLDIRGDELAGKDSQDEIQAAKEYGRTRTQFKQGNEYRFRPMNREIPGQQGLDFDREMANLNT